MTKEEFQAKHLPDNEEILWFGKPDSLGYFQRTDMVLVPISLILGGFLLFYCYMQIMMMLSGQSFAFALSGITLFLIGIYLIFGRIWYRHKRLSRNIYVVTNQRCIVFNTLRDTFTADIPLELVQADYFQTTLFLGDKLMGGDLIYGLGLDIFLRNFVHESPAFYAISNAPQVLKTIKRAKKNVRKVTHDSDEFI